MKYYGISRAVYMTTAGLGFASMLATVEMQINAREHRANLQKDFRAQRDLVYMLKLKELRAK
jgi:hypothetical protein